MISKKAVREFLELPMENWDWLKDVPNSELESQPAITKHKFKTSPYAHQIVSFILGVVNPGFLFFLDMGLGKSFVALNLISYHRKSKGNFKTLILTPSLAGVYGWEEQIKIHCDLTYVLMQGNKSERQIAFKKDVDIYVLNYAGLQSFMSKRQKDKKGKNKLVPDLEKAKEFVDKFGAVIYDEIHICKNGSTLTTKLCRIISRQCVYRYGLTGTPFGRDLQDLWAQFYLVDFGATLGGIITLFRQAYFSCKVNYWGGYDYVLKPDSEKKLRVRIKNQSIWYPTTSVVDLPEKVRNLIPIPLSEEAQDYYSKVLEGIIEAQGNIIELKNSYVRLRQICSGFLQFKDSSEIKQTIVFHENAKLDAFMELINSIGIENKIVVFNEFIESGRLIAERLKKEKIGFQRLYSGTKDKRGAVDNFRSKKNQRVFICNSASGAQSLNLQQANYIVFFESPVSPIIRAQAEKRCHRIGQKKTVFIYDLVAKIAGSVEEKILKYLKEGKDLEKAIFSGKDALKK